MICLSIHSAESLPSKYTGEAYTVYGEWHAGILLEDYGAFQVREMSPEEFFAEQFGGASVEPLYRHRIRTGGGHSWDTR